MENEKLNEKPWKEEIYFHVCNGGATISIEQSEYGAKIRIRTAKVLTESLGFIICLERNISIEFTFC